MENIIENNKLIAEFMGLSKIISDIPLYEFENTAYSMNKLKFNKSWDWLIPVIDKIRTVLIKNYYNFYHDWQPVFDKALIELKIDNLYKIVLEFIKWNNKTAQIKL